MGQIGGGNPRCDPRLLVDWTHRDVLVGEVMWRCVATQRLP